MRFSRTAFIAAIYRALASERREYDAKWDAYREAISRSETDWLREYAERCTDALAAAIAKLENDEPITRSDLPCYPTGSLRDNILVYHGPVDSRGHRVNPPGEFRESTDLRAMLNVLELCTEEEVTTNGLKELGIGQATMSAVVRALRSAGTS